MKFKHTHFIHIIFLFSIVLPQSFHVQPYIQNISRSNAIIMWETTSGNQSIVEWGTTPSLGEITSGDAVNSYNSAYVHTVSLEYLDTNTQYFYKVKTNSLESDVFSFVTQKPFSFESSTRLVAMSDMQKDWSNWDKFEEIVHDGIIDYIEDDLGETLPLALDMVLIPGDLVDDGHDYDQWSDHFFGPAHPLFAYSPVYPVYGNHEQNTSYFSMYFDLPHNASQGYDEHWWWKDVSNVRVIGLDSNGNYQINEQLSWLDEILDQSCTDEHIDFVFAQLHHPHHSELWIAGNTDFTGEVITRLENFSTQCGKPSIHFFGHTHGYSRGQSMEHQHVMVNVASAGGAIDNWGEYAQFDYPEYSVSQDEWGFIVVDIEAGDNPQFTIKRISRGNELQPRDNELRDEVTIRLWNTPPSTPVPTAPIGANINPDLLVLDGGNFIDVDGDEHGFTQWQISSDCYDFSNPIVDEYEAYENWYFNIDTQAGNSLTTFEMDYVPANTEYCWRTRYRDKHLVWSEWSEPLEFSTGNSLFSANLITNGDAENGIDGWTINEGVFESLLAFDCNGVEPNSGDYYFSVGGLCESSEFAEVMQNIDVIEYANCIDSEEATVRFSGYLSNWGGDDIPEMHIEFLDAFHNVISVGESLTTNISNWTELSQTMTIPIQTSNIRVVLTGTRYAGDDNDSYFDDVSLNILTTPTCNVLMGDVNADEFINILDVIIIINIVMDNEATEYQYLVADVNEDGIINILDIVMLVNIILNN